MGRAHRYAVRLPDGACPSADGWPLLLLLPGRGRDPQVLFDAASPFEQIQWPAGLAIVVPAGEEGWYIDSAVIPVSRYQTMLRELLVLARCTLSLAAAPARTTIAGWSMGGFGAVRFALDCPQDVGVVVSMIGLLDYPNPSLPVYPVAPVFGAAPENWPAFNCMTDAGRLRGKSILLCAARKDWTYPMSVNFRARLEQLGIACAYREYGGTHSVETVAAMLPDVFQFIEARSR